MIKIKIAGIYKISINELYYIGKSVSIFDRWQSHIHQLVMGTHHSPKLQDAFEFEGLENFRFEILEVISLSQFKTSTKLKGKELETQFNRHLLMKEKEWMSKYSINYCLNKDQKHFS